MGKEVFLENNKVDKYFGMYGPSHPSPFTELQNKNNYTNTILLNRHLHGPLFMNNECNMGLE